MKSRLVGIEAARATLKDLCATAARGEEVVITRRGKPIARVVSVAGPAPGTLWVWDGHQYLEARRYADDTAEAHARLCAAMGKPPNSIAPLVKLVDEVVGRLDVAASSREAAIFDPGKTGKR